jgi:hypothetical protein
MSTRQRHGNQTGKTKRTVTSTAGAGAGCQAEQQQQQQQPSSSASAAANNGTALHPETSMARAAAARPGSVVSWIPRWRQQQQQQQQHTPLLSWRLTFRHDGVELSYWQQRCEQRLLLLDKLVLFLNVLVLLNVASSSSGGLDLALHAVSLLLLVVQGAVMSGGEHRYVRWRPWLVLLQRLWHAVMRVQQLQLTAPAAVVAAAAAGVPAGACVTATAAAGSAAAVAAGETAGTAATAAAACAAAPAAAAAVAVPPDVVGGSSPWQVFFDTAVVASGVAPNWAYTWAYQTPFGTAPLLQLCCLLCVLLADAGRLLQLLAAPQLQHCVAAAYNAASTVSNLLLLPLLPLAGLPTAGACPAMPALPLLLWLQLFLALAAPLYVLYCFERSSKVWFWLQRLAAMSSVPYDLAQEAQRLLRQVGGAAGRDVCYWMDSFAFQPCATTHTLCYNLVASALLL